MVTNSNSTVSRPPKVERDKIRRDQIVSAAKFCVVRQGFHGASMANIAKQAQMSVGQIYRYFPHKEAIIHAIVERIVAERLKWIAGTEQRPDLPATLATRMFADEQQDGDDRVLLMEVTAEATRNPAVAAIVRAADHQLHARAVAAVLKDYPHLTEKDAAARVEFVAVLMEGTAFRRVTEQPADPAMLLTLYRRILDSVLPGLGAEKVA